MKYLKYIRYYLKYRKEINQHYSYAIHHAGDYGCPSPDENANWYQRTDYWLRSE